MRFWLWPACVIAASVGLASPSCAQSTATRTWVSGVGDDSNPCSRTAPCLTFAGAITKTAAGGEIDVLDPGNFGHLNITKSITIRADSVEAGILLTGDNAVTVNAGSGDTVVLEGLDLDGQMDRRSAGVLVNSAGLVYVLDCAIRGFAIGVLNANTTSSARVVVRDSYITTSIIGAEVDGGSNALALSNTLVDGNQGEALYVGSGGPAALVGSILSGPGGITNAGGSVNSIGPSNVITGPGAPTATTPYR